MVIKIEDYEFGNDNFEYEIFVNGSKRATNVNASRELLIEAQSNDVVMIRAKNIVLSSKWGWLFMFFYWFLAILI